MNPNNLDATKSTNSGYVTIGDVINYSIILTNNGPVSNFNMLLTDLIPQGANFVDNSIFINNINIINSNPALRVTLPDMPVGSITTITFNAQVTNVPVIANMENVGQIDYQFTQGASIMTTSIYTNTVTTTISQAQLALTKIAPITSTIGQSLTFTVNVNNIGNATAFAIRFIDTIPVGTQFIPNSVYVSGVQQIGANPSPPNGLGVFNTNGGTSRSVVYSVQVVSLPPWKSIINVGDTSYQYIKPFANPTTILNRTSSNITSTTLAFADLSGITKSIDSTFATCGDIITYTITIPNSGLITATNVIVNDSLSNGLTYVPGTLFINSIPSGDSLTTINVGNIGPGSTTILTFKAKITC